MAALERLYVESGPRLWRAVFAYSGDREVTDDAVAEAFAQALARGDAIESPDRWVWRAAFKIAAGELKARRRSRSLQAEGSWAMPEPVDDIMRALGTLTPKQRAATVLYYYMGYPAREIADILSTSHAAVRVHLSQGRKRLRSELENDDG